MLVIGSVLFVLTFVLIAPASRAFIFASLGGVADWMVSWAPFSFLLLTILLVAPVAAIYLIKTWPVHVEPENPMAKYRRQDVDEDQF